jgi:hypothetical protein
MKLGRLKGAETTSALLSYTAELIQTVQAQTWSGVIRLTCNSGLSSSPCIAADSGDGIHVVWFDETPGMAEIYYRNRK